MTVDIDESEEERQGEVEGDKQGTNNKRGDAESQALETNVGLYRAIPSPLLLHQSISEYTRQERFLTGVDLRRANR